MPDTILSHFTYLVSTPVTTMRQREAEVPFCWVRDEHKVMPEDSVPKLVSFRWSV